MNEASVDEPGPCVWVIFVVVGHRRSRCVIDRLIQTQHGILDTWPHLVRDLCTRWCEQASPKPHGQNMGVKHPLILPKFSYALRMSRFIPGRNPRCKIGHKTGGKSCPILAIYLESADFGHKNTSKSVLFEHSRQKRISAAARNSPSLPPQILHFKDYYIFRGFIYYSLL